MMINRSIRFKMAFWFSVVLIVVAAVTFFAVRGASRIVLRNTIRDYLIGTVENNAAQIEYTDTRGDSAANYYITYGDGFLEIDLDFTNIANNVYTALYTQDGVMLYGENPLSRQTFSAAFDETRTWDLKLNGIRYHIYDRRLNIALQDDGVLWMRGVVSENESVKQMEKITQISLLFLPILLILAVIAAFALAGRLVAPLRSMERTASQISMGDDLDRRIDVKNRKDEIGQLASVFNMMFDRLEGSFEKERQFTSDASHELRTPLSVILAQSEYTLESDRSPEEYREALEVINRQGGRMSTLINDMLDYTRMDQSPDRYPMEPVDLSLTVREAAEQQTALLERGITLSADIEDGITVSGNRILLSRLVTNLLTNACRYGRDGGHIDVCLRASDKSAVLTVADDGIGIPEEHLDRIFDRFYRVDTSRSGEGTGLGLSMVKRIAELHGAGVTVDSTPGVGSTFTVVFKIL